MEELNNSWGNAEANHFRNPILMDDSARIFSRQNEIPPLGSSRPLAPPIPPRPYGGNMMSQAPYNAYGSNYCGAYNSLGGFMPGMYGGGGYGRYGGGYGYGTMGGGDAENRFIQIAEESSRSAFQSIESVVNAVLNIAQMLDSTYFALTSSFRAVLGVAANFGRLRGLFSQFWTSFAFFRGLNWLYQKILYTLRLSNIDPGTKLLQEAYAAAAAEGSNTTTPMKNSSSLAVIAFLAFIMIGPFMLMKLIGTVSNTAIEETKNPKSWINPIEAIVQYDFIASSSSELSVRMGQNIMVAPKNVQHTHKLLDSGWVLASIDGIISGLVPVNYIESTKQAKNKERISPTLPIIQEPTKEHTESDAQRTKEVVA